LVVGVAGAAGDPPAAAHESPPGGSHRGITRIAWRVPAALRRSDRPAAAIERWAGAGCRIRTGGRPRARRRPRGRSRQSRQGGRAAQQSLWRRMTPCIRPRDLALLLLDSCDLPPRQRARDQQPDLAGLALKRRLLERLIAIDPEAEAFETAL